MQVASTQPTSATQSGESLQKAASTTLNADFEMFLKLFMKQLQNQDPTDPMDTTTQLSQLAQFSSVEQGVKTNQALDQILNRLEQRETQADLAYLGKTIETTSDQISLTEDGSVFYVDGIEQDRAITAVVKSQGGETIKTLKTASTEGRTTITWDGSNESGARVSNGLYRIEISAPGENEDQSQPLEATVRDTVREVKSIDGRSTLGLASGLSITSDRIRSITAT